MPSVFSSLKDLADSVHGSDKAIQTEPFLTVCRQITPVVGKFGTSFIMVKTDINSNIDRLEAAHQRQSAQSPELFEIILAEISRGKQGDKYSDTKGLLWLKRAMEFLVALLLRLYEDKSVSMGTAASEAYQQTLYQFHTWYTSAAFQLALKLVPSREAFFEKLEASSQPAMEEMHAFLEVFAPILAEIEGFLKAHNLDDPTPV